MLEHIVLVLRPAVLVGIIFTIYPMILVIYNLCFHPLRHIPGPWTWSSSRLPFIKALLTGTLIHDIEKLHLKYGPILRIAPDEVTFAQPEAWNDIFQLRPGHKPFLKHALWWKSQSGEHESLLGTIEPEPHARIRKLLAPGFTPKALRSQEPILYRYVSLLISRLEDLVQESAAPATQGVQLDIVPWLNFTTFDIFGDLGFGESFNCLEHSQYHPWIALLFNFSKAAAFIAAARFYPFLEWLLMRCIPSSIMKMRRNHQQQIVDKVQRRLNWEVERPDIMSHVLQQRVGDKRGLLIGEINSTFLILTIAGSETTATALSGAMTYLLRDPERMRRTVQEVRERFSSAGELTLDKLKDLPYLNAVLHETLRLCPPVPWMLPRQVPEGGDTVCSVWLPGGTPVSLQAWALHRSTTYFHNATSFEPERWIMPSISTRDSLYMNDHLDAVQPFNVGPHSCIGQNLAWAEMRLILSNLLWRFDFVLGNNELHQWEDLRTFLLVEKKPINVQMRLRNL